MTAPVQVGDILADKYRVERVLGQGGMGIVVGARHLHLGESVAIKFLLPAAMTNPQAVLRFSREARAAARIKSEHVGRVYDVGTLPGGAPYMVMEFLEGDDLSALLAKKGPLPFSTAVEYLVQACEAIAVAHAAGVVHRDLKPSNLFLTRGPDGSPCIKVIDFGISKVLPRDQEDIAAGELTESAMMMGSPYYMPPEQMRSAREVDGRADVWSLGCILFALLTGAPPFSGETVIGVFESILRGVPPVESRRPDVPVGFDAVLERALMPEPEDRYADVAAFCVALTPFASSEARRSIERVGRTLRGTLPEGDVDLAGATAPMSPSKVSGAAGDGGTAGSWESARTSPSSVKGARRTLIAVGTLVVIGAGAALAYRSLGAATDAPGALAAPTVSADASMPSVSKVTLEAPVVLAQPTASASSAPEVTASTTTPSATVPAPPVAKVPQGRPRPTPTRPSAPPDLFAEPQ